MRLAASSRISQFIHPVPTDIKEGDEVDIMIASVSDLGYNVIINNKYIGLVYDNQVFQEVWLGEKRKGYISRIREDKKIDVSLQPQGKGLINDAREIVLSKLKEAHGFLPFNDNSDPGEISRAFGISKKAFKKAIGGLYKDRVIMITDEGIRLQEEE